MMLGVSVLSVGLIDMDLLVFALLDEELDQGGVCSHTPASKHWVCEGELKVPGCDSTQVWSMGSSDGSASWEEVSSPDILLCSGYSYFK